MLRFVADENFSYDIVRGVLRRNPSIDIVTVQDEALSGTDDSAIPEWAATADRIVLTHDVSTMTRDAYARVANGKPMPGVFEIGERVPIAIAIDEILLLAEASFEGE